MNTAEVGEPVSRRRVLWLAGKELVEGSTLEDLGLRGRVGAPARPFLIAGSEFRKSKLRYLGRYGL